MAIESIDDLKKHLGRPEIGATFAAAFAERYFAVAFGSTPKSELDQLVFDALIEVEAIDPQGPIYEIARALRITPARARSLLFQHQLRHDDQDLDQRVLKTLSEAKFSIDDRRLSFGVESPLVRTVIDARLKRVGIFSDISMSGEILRIPTNQLGTFVRVFLKEDRARALEARLRAAGSDKGLVDALNQFGKAVAADMAGDVARDGIQAAMKEMFAWLGGGDAAGAAGGAGGGFTDTFAQYFNAG